MDNGAHIPDPEAGSQYEREAGDRSDSVRTGYSQGSGVISEVSDVTLLLAGAVKPAASSRRWEAGSGLGPLFLPPACAPLGLLWTTEVVLFRPGWSDSRTSMPCGSRSTRREIRVKKIAYHLGPPVWEQQIDLPVFLWTRRLQEVKFLRSCQILLRCWTLNQNQSRRAEGMRHHWEAVLNRKPANSVSQGDEINLSRLWLRLCL
ncbi:hypothetical protein CapIbe_011200 [Capra ibex]